MEVGRVNIIVELSMMESQMAMPMEGHLEAFLHVFVFICQHYNSKMVFDPTYPAINMNNFKECK